MRLISLTANQPSFHPVEFNPTGISLIVGAQKDRAKREASHTYNGVGKSLLIALIHFCLGSDKNDEFSNKLPEWQFTLRFSHRGHEYRVSRRTETQNVISLDGEELSLKNFRNTMADLVFPNATNISGLKFRGLITRFIRPRKESYNAFDSVSSKATPFYNLLQNAYLLGINTDLVIKKHDLREQQEAVRKLQRSLNNDPIFREFFTENKNPEIELADLESQIEELRGRLDRFQVAEDYHERQTEANEATRQLQALRNESTVVANAIREIDCSLEISPDIAPDSVTRVFEEANAALPEMVCKRMDEVAAFHRALLENRVKRLTAERAALERRLDRIAKDIAKANRTADKLRRFLGSHGALDEFLAMSGRLSELEAKAQKLRDYQSLLEQYSDREQELTAAMSKETIRTNRYLRDAKPILDSNMERFRALSRRFYGKRPGGLTVRNNDGENQLRFEIEARIEDDAADGINEVKIFCYDWTVLTQQHGHAVQFVVHDSRLFSDVDIRQRSTIFKVVQEWAEKERYQYIATLNQDHIDAMRDQFTAKEFRTCIEKSVVLRLTDEDARSKLLGIQVDMNY